MGVVCQRHPSLPRFWQGIRRSPSQTRLGGNLIKPVLFYFILVGGATPQVW